MGVLCGKCLPAAQACLCTGLLVCWRAACCWRAGVLACDDAGVLLFYGEPLFVSGSLPGPPGLYPLPGHDHCTHLLMHAPTPCLPQADSQAFQATLAATSGAARRPGQPKKAAPLAPGARWHLPDTDEETEDEGRGLGLGLGAAYVIAPGMGYGMAPGMAPGPARAPVMHHGGCCSSVGCLPCWCLCQHERPGWSVSCGFGMRYASMCSGG